MLEQIIAGLSYETGIRLTFIGLLILILAAGRKMGKKYMTAWGCISCTLVVLLIIGLLGMGLHRPELTFAFGEFFKSHRGVTVYLAGINLLTFLLFGIDKYGAVSHKGRIRVSSLLSLAFIGGSIGGLAAVYLFRHKTKKQYFTAGIPYMIVMQILLLFYWMNMA